MKRKLTLKQEEILLEIHEHVQLRLSEYYPPVVKLKEAGLIEEAKYGWTLTAAGKAKAAELSEKPKT